MKIVTRSSNLFNTDIVDAIWSQIKGVLLTQSLNSLKQGTDSFMTKYA